MPSRFTMAGRAIAGLITMTFVAAYLFENTMMALAGSIMLLYLTYRRMEFHSLVRRIDIDIERSILEDVMHKDSPSSIKIKCSSSETVNVRIEERIHGTFHLKEGERTLKGRVGPGKPLSMIYSVIPRERGSFKFPSITLTITEARGFFESKKMVDPGTEALIRASKKDISMARLMARRKQFEITGPAHQRHTRTKRADFRTIRDYVPGDRFRDIDWKAMSRFTKLMTKEFEEETNLPTMILMDTSISMKEMVKQRSKMDHGIALALQIAIVMNSNSHPIGLISFDDNKVIDHMSPGKSTLDDVLMSLFKLPNPVEIGKYPGNPENLPISKTEGEDEFLSKVGPFLVEGKRRSFSRIRTTGIYESFRAIELTEETGMLLIIISDLETNRPSFVRAVQMGLRRKHRIVLISPFSWPYHLEKGTAGVEKVEKMYEDYLEKQTLLRSLRAGGVKVIDIDHRERGGNVIVGIRRMSK